MLSSSFQHFIQLIIIKQRPGHSSNRLLSNQLHCSSIPLARNSIISPSNNTHHRRKFAKNNTCTFTHCLLTHLPARE